MMHKFDIVVEMRVTINVYYLKLIMNDYDSMVLRSEIRVSRANDAPN
jgi:hypothetical protein